MGRKPKQTDIFAYTNKLLAIKDELDAELFFVSKNFVPFCSRLGNDVQRTIGALFVDPFLEDIFDGSETGMTVRDIDYASHSGMAGILIRTDLSGVSNAASVIEWIEDKRDSIEYFDDTSVVFKNMRGIVVRFTHKSDKSIKFYAVRALDPKVVMRATSWKIDGETISKLDTDIAFKVPADNQVIIVGNDTFVFNMRKFEKLFNFSYVKLTQADAKAKLFEEKFKVSVPTALVGIQNILRESDVLLNKFLKTDISLIDQETVMNMSDSLGLGLMADDAGATIIEDRHDLSVMLDIIADNYYESEATGQHYVARSKKEVKVEQ